MTSKEQASECFVYITLPGETDSVTAGRFVLTQDRLGNQLGRFVYGASYLSRADAVEVDPIELKLTKIRTKQLVLVAYLVPCETLALTFGDVA
jgi:serine/threonine-protein kinase HipA